MLQRFASTAFVVGTLLTASLPEIGLAQDRRGKSGGGRNNFSSRSAGSNSPRSFSGGGRNYRPGGSSGGSHYSGRQSFVNPRSYSTGPTYYGRSYIAPRFYGRPVYRPNYSGGIYLGYGVPYG